MNTDQRFAITIHALALLASRDEPLTSEVIADSVNTNPVVIRRALASLREHGLVGSKPGPNGGWRLLRRPNQIGLREVYRGLGPSDLLAMHIHPNKYCRVGAHIKGALTEVFAAAQAGMEKTLEKYTVQDVLNDVLARGQELNSKRPYTYINVAMTADGKIDTLERKGAAISSPRDKERVDRLRSESDAILVGGHTLLEEDPELTVKSEALRAERIARGLAANPVKVGVVTIANLNPDSDFVQAGPARVVIFASNQSSNDQLDMLRSSGVEVFVHPEPRVDLVKMMQTLKEIGINRLMVEGGGTINFELIRLGLVDEITAYVAPLIFGGANAPTMADGLGVPREAALHLSLIDVEKWDDSGVLLHYHVK